MNGLPKAGLRSRVSMAEGDDADDQEFELEGCAKSRAWQVFGVDIEFVSMVEHVDTFHTHGEDVFRNSWRGRGRGNEMRGSLYRRGKIWWMACVVDRKQHCESTGTTNKRVAQKILNKRLGEIVEGRFQLPNSNPPRLQEFSQEFLESIRHQNTKKRYASSVANLSAYFGDVRLSDFNLV